MATQAQIIANQENAQHSTGPRSEIGKAASSQNNFRHGFTGAFGILEWEKREEYESLYNSLMEDHCPASTTEHILVKTMAESHWLRERALTLQTMCIDPAGALCERGLEKQLALFLRYQTTNDRAFSNALNQLLKLRADKQKQEIGFESQNRKEAVQTLRAERCEAREKRQEAAEKRAEEIHEARIWLIGAQTRLQETEATIRTFERMPQNQQSQPAKAA